MSEKVKLPREVAEAVCTIRKAGMAEHALYNYNWLDSEVDSTAELGKAKEVILNFVDFSEDRFNPDNQLIRYYKALVNGFEGEETPEEAIKRKYSSYSPTDDYGNAYRQAVRDTLNTLGISIGGVNA